MSPLKWTPVLAQSDLDVWKKLGVISETDAFDDGGLYTGEICLHIAIVSNSAAEDPELVRWMLENGSEVRHMPCAGLGMASEC